MKDLKKHAPIISLVLFVIAAVMLFLEPALVYKISEFGTTVKTDVAVSGFRMIFGIEDNVDLNILGTVAVVLLLAGAIIPFLKLDDKLKHLIAAIAFIAGGVLLFVYPSTIETIFGSYVVGWPLIVAGSVGILAGLVNLAGALA